MLPYIQTVGHSHLTEIFKRSSVALMIAMLIKSASQVIILGIRHSISSSFKSTLSLLLAII